MRGGVSVREFRWCLVAKSRKFRGFWAISKDFTDDGEVGHGVLTSCGFHWRLVARSGEAKGTGTSSGEFHQRLVVGSGEASNKDGRWRYQTQ